MFWDLVCGFVVDKFTLRAGFVNNLKAQSERVMSAIRPAICSTVSGTLIYTGSETPAEAHFSKLATIAFQLLIVQSSFSVKLQCLNQILGSNKQNSLISDIVCKAVRTFEGEVIAFVRFLQFYSLMIGLINSAKNFECWEWINMWQNCGWNIC